MRIKHRYRSRTEIAARILQSANGGRVSKTRIMYRACISYEQIKAYLAFLMENGLIEYQEETQTYRTTGKGIKFLDVYEKMADMVSEAELPVKVW